MACFGRAHKQKATAASITKYTFLFFLHFQGLQKNKPIAQKRLHNRGYRCLCIVETIGVSQNLKHLAFGCLQKICWSCCILNNLIPISQLSSPQRKQGKACPSITPPLSNHLFSPLPFSPANIIPKHGRETLLKGLPKQRVKRKRDGASSYLQGE